MECLVIPRPLFFWRSAWIRVGPLIFFIKYELSHWTLYTLCLLREKQTLNKDCKLLENWQILSVIVDNSSPWNLKLVWDKKKLSRSGFLYANYGTKLKYLELFEDWGIMQFFYSVFLRTYQLCNLKNGEIFNNLLKSTVCRSTESALTLNIG